MKVKVLLLAILVFTLLGCGEGTIIGKWKQKTIVFEGHEFPGRQEILEFSENGFFTVTDARDNHVINEGKWEYDVNDHTITFIRSNGFEEKVKNVSIDVELRFTGRDYEVIFSRVY